MALALQKQWDYYLSKEEEFLKNCYGKFVVINEKLEVYVMDTLGDAYKLGCAAFGLGNFLIQECVEQQPVYVGTAIRQPLEGRRFVKTDTGYRLEVLGKGERGDV